MRGGRGGILRIGHGCNLHCLQSSWFEDEFCPLYPRCQIHLTTRRGAIGDWGGLQSSQDSVMVVTSVSIHFRSAPDMESAAPKAGVTVSIVPSSIYHQDLHKGEGGIEGLH